MIDIPITKPFNNDLLREQLLAVFPAWAIINPAGLPDTAFYFMRDTEETWHMHAPDDADLLAVQAIIDAHNANEPSSIERRDTLLAFSRLGLTTIPGWATYSADEARDAITNAVLAGMDEAQFDAWVDANITANSVATIKASFKNLGKEVIQLRDMTARLAMMVANLRDLNA
ncbi:MAG: hypothetical protein EHM35_15345 [Planctomycetaceae bacterium]|nr:MAG: hypothetical protein EHM35_15345 [Planctomycetaceae bacterium]